MSQNFNALATGGWIKHTTLIVAGSVQLFQYFTHTLLISSAVTKGTADPAHSNSPLSSPALIPESQLTSRRAQFPKWFGELVVDLRYPALPSNLLDTWHFLLFSASFPLSLFFCLAVWHTASSNTLPPPPAFCLCSSQCQISVFLPAQSTQTHLCQNKKRKQLQMANKWILIAIKIHTPGSISFESVVIFHSISTSVTVDTGGKH